MHRLWFLVLLLSLTISCGTEQGLSNPNSSQPTFGGSGFGSGGDPGSGQSGDGTSGDDSGEEHWGDPANPGDKPDAQNGTVGQDDPFEQECGYGTIYGLICSKTDQMFVNDAQVWVEAADCDGAMVKRQTISDKDGFYTLTDVPQGLQTVHIEKDGWTKEYPVQVIAGKLSDVTGVGYKECFQVVKCEEDIQSVPVESSFVTGLADIVLFIDTSGSMKQEAKWVQENVNAFAQYIGNQQVNYHVVLVGDGYGLCVPPPLGGPNCTDGPNFRHIKEKVGSSNGLEKLISTYPWYQDFLRAGATTNFIAVTDDNSKKSASWFKTKVKQQVNPGFSDPFVFHSIVAYGDIPFVGCLGGAFGGTVYLELTDQTGGAKFPVCETDWKSVFSQMAETVVNSVSSACAYKLLDPGKVAAGDSFKLTYDKGQGSTPIAQVSGGNACNNGTGFYFDNEENPELLMLCPATCDMLENGWLSLFVECE